MTNSERTQRNLQVSKTIMSQIGNMAFRMIGARQFTAIDNGLQFRIGRNSKGINCIQVELNGSDLYNMKFWSIRGTSCKMKAESTDLYFDMLRGEIERQTGLYTKF